MCRSPTQTVKFTTSLDFRREVIRRIKLLGRVRTQHAALSNVKLGTGEAAPAERKLAFKQRPFSLVPPRIIAIGSSYGGSASAECSTRRGVGVVVPDSRRGGATHAAGLHRHPERLARATGRETKEGTQDETLKPGTIYVALGNHHMTVVRPANPALRIGNEPPVHFCRPAVDPLFATWPRPSGRRRSASCSPAWAMMVRPAPAPSPRTRGAA